jgi:hypothetical protein
MATTKKPHKGKDLALLQKMTEPLSVLVVKKKGTSEQPVALPGKDGRPLGTGWERDDVLELERFVLNQEGGGFYEGKVTDANGVTMEWPFGWDPRSIPEKVSPHDQPYASQPPAAAPPAPGQPIPLAPNPLAASAPLGSGQSWLSQQMMPSYPYAPPQGAQAVQAGQMPLGWPGGLPGMSSPFGPSPWWQSMSGGASTPINGGESERMRQLEERLAAAERESLKKEYDAALERQRNESAAQLSALKDELRRISEAKPTGPDPEVVRMREETDRLRREKEIGDLRQGFQEQINLLRGALEKLATNPGESDAIKQIRDEQRRTEERLERERMEQRHRDELREIRDQMNKGPDPMLTYLTENSRQQTETAREIARSQKESMERVTQQMVSPVQMMEMIQKQSGGVDGLVKSIIGSFGGAFETYRMMMESLVQMQGGGQSPAQAMLQQGMDRFSDIANQYLAYQRDKAVHEAQAKAASAKAQAKTADAVRAQTEYASRRPPQGYDEGLASPGPSPEAQAEAVADDGANGQSGEAQPAEVIDINDRRPPTEEEMFGPALESVQHLRQGVADGKMRPDQAVAAIIQGVAVCEQQGLQIPAFSLFAEGRFADLMDALLPQAPQQFRDACVGILYAQFEEMQQMMADEGDEDDDQPEGP